LLNNENFPKTNNFNKKISKTEKELNFIKNSKKDIIKHKNSKKEYLEMISEDSLNEYYVKKCNIILEYAYKEERNHLNRTYMEDKGKSILNYNNDKNKLLFCLFDGHGGDEVSTYLQKNYFKIMKKYLNEKEQNEGINFEQLFKEIDEEFKGCKYYKIGSTATIIYITRELIDGKMNEAQKVLYCINIGDTKCILTQTTGSRKLSYDDLLTDKSEYNRIIEEGGYIKNGRVCGQLMISRAFGDWEIKPYGLICTPHVTKLSINKDCKYVIVATDGVWDVLDDLDVYKLSLSTENSKNLCDDIIKSALEKKSGDNLSCFVIKLND
jgi:serine/threonine protein phosphatase PrpC